VKGESLPTLGSARRDPKLSELDAYMAGILDGEGSIILYRGKNRLGSLVLFPSVKIVNTDPKIHQLVSKYGFHLHVERRTGRNKDAYIGQLMSPKQIAEFLPKVIPYLILKLPQALLLLEYVTSRIGKRWGSSYSTRELELSDGITFLNRRGRD
jgi:hypothetical protein